MPGRSRAVGALPAELAAAPAEGLVARPDAWRRWMGLAHQAFAAGPA
jgi:hypothetical protein